MVAQMVSPDVSSDVLQEISTVFSQMTMSIAKCANAQFKTRVYLDPRELDIVKKSLKSFICDNEKAEVFKDELLDDLEEFQRDISQSHTEKIKQNTVQKNFLEGKIRILEREKNKIVFERLSKVEWPYTRETKLMDVKISQLNAQVTQLAQKIHTMSNSRPEACEKDILLYKMKLKQKYSL